MGDYFDKDDDEKEESSVEEEQPVDEEDESVYDFIADERQKIIVKILRERQILFGDIQKHRKPLKDRIGRFNLNLFGDPDSDEFESTLAILKKEVSHPMSKQHPISQKLKAVIVDIQQFQEANESLRRYDDSHLGQLGKLLDLTITEFKKVVGELGNKKVEAPEEDKEEEPKEETKAVSTREKPTEDQMIVWKEWLDWNLEGYLERVTEACKNKHKAKLAANKGNFHRGMQKIFGLNSSLSFDAEFKKLVYIPCIKASERKPAQQSSLANKENVTLSPNIDAQNKAKAEENDETSAFAESDLDKEDVTIDTKSGDDNEDKEEGTNIPEKGEKSDEYTNESIGPGDAVQSED